MSQRLLEGDVIETNGEASEVQRLRDTNRALTRELSDALEENEELRKRVAVADAPISRLREKLGPFYRLLQSIFGDIEEIGPEVASSETEGSMPQHIAKVWQAWKDKLPGSPARIIDALITHRELNTTQIVVAAKMDRRTVNQAIYKLNQAGLINKNGGRFSLKQL